MCSLPFKTTGELGRGKHVAIANMLQLEKKFCKSPDLKQKYTQRMNDYFEQGHAVPAEHEENFYMRKTDDRIVYDCYFMPHLAVLK